MEERPPQYLRMNYTMSLPFRFSAGPYAGRFLREIRDNKRLIGNRCPKCQRVMLPPRIVCARCHVKAGEFVEVSNQGVIEAFTYVNFPMIDPTTGKPKEIPYGVATILLDGCDSHLYHFLEEKDEGKVKVGMRGEMVFKEEGRIGDLTDILFIRIIK